MKLFSTVKVEAVVEARVVPPIVVRPFAKTSPSASTRNLTPPATAMPKRFPSATEEAGFTKREELVTLEPAVSMAQAPKVWGLAGAAVAASWLDAVVVADTEKEEELAIRNPPTFKEPENMPLPFTEKVSEGVVVPMPIL